MNNPEMLPESLSSDFDKLNLHAMKPNTQLEQAAQDSSGEGTSSSPQKISAQATDKEMLGKDMGTPV